MRPLILVTNDDGGEHPGLRVAVNAVKGLGDLIVAAPQAQQTAMGRSYPKAPEVGRIEKRTIISADGEKVPVYCIIGSPAQVISYAVLELCDRQPDLCLAGVNFGENLGTTLTGSGTVGAALEAESYGIPSIAISLQVTSGHSPDSVDWSWSEYFTRLFAKHVLDRGVLKDAPIVNVNIPHGANKNTPIRRTVQSHQPYFIFRKPKRPNLLTSVALCAEAVIDESALEENSDIKAVIVDQVISVTLLSWSMSSVSAWPLPAPLTAPP